jgi:hypothetical protein
MRLTLYEDEVVSLKLGRASAFVCKTCAFAPLYLIHPQSIIETVLHGPQPPGSLARSSEAFPAAAHATSGEG